MNKINCKQITNGIRVIRSKRGEFICGLNSNKTDLCLKLMKEINSIFKEITDHIWLLETLTEENIKQQYDEWKEVYNEIYTLPSVERIYEFFRSNSDFVKLMREKEKQGLTKMIIAPAPGSYSLNKLMKIVGLQIGENSGTGITYNSWSEMFSDENKIHYFGTIDNSDPNNPKPKGGVTAKEIYANPEKYGVCDDWIISFTTDEQNIARDYSPQTITGNGRMAIPTNLTPVDYQKDYFSHKLGAYKGEKAMIPQEYFALFWKDLYEKYIKLNKKFTTDESNDLLDSETETSFVSTYLPGNSSLPNAGWISYEDVLECKSDPPGAKDFSVGVRSVVRNIKS